MHVVQQALQNRSRHEHHRRDDDQIDRYASNFLATKCQPPPRGAFSLLELLIVLAISSLLMALLMPNFVRLRESARQAGCSSNQHQIGLALALYSDENNERLPSSYYGSRGETGARKMIAAYLGPPKRWDSMGLLHRGGLMRSPELLYCPSHTGAHPFEKYTDDWVEPKNQLIEINYHYRQKIGDLVVPASRIGTLQLRYPLEPILTDGMRTKQDFNHVVGTNTLRLDSSVKWFDDTARKIYNSLPDESDSDPEWQQNPWSELTKK